MNRTIISACLSMDLDMESTNNVESLQVSDSNRELQNDSQYHAINVCLFLGSVEDWCGVCMYSHE